jgi:transcriptional regulator with XRE-family HTH domain
MSVENDNTFGKLLRELRRHLRLSQEGLAAALGVSFPTVSRWERGKSKPNRPAWATLSQYIEDACSGHPDLLARFRKEASLQGFPAHTIGRPKTHQAEYHFPASMAPKELRPIIFMFGGQRGTPDEHLNAELLKYAKSTGQAMQKLFWEAQSGNANAREALRLTCEFANRAGRAGMLEALRALLTPTTNATSSSEGKRFKGKKRGPVAG